MHFNLYLTPKITVKWLIFAEIKICLIYYYAKFIFKLFLFLILIMKLCKYNTCNIKCRIMTNAYNKHHWNIFQVYQQVLNDQGKSLLDSLVASVTAEKSAIENVRYQQDLLNICERINGVCYIENFCTSQKALFFIQERHHYLDTKNSCK